MTDSKPLDLDAIEKLLEQPWLYGGGEMQEDITALLAEIRRLQALTDEIEYYRSCGSCKWQIDTSEGDRYAGRCPKCGDVTLQWAKPTDISAETATLQARVVEQSSENAKLEARIGRLERTLTSLQKLHEQIGAGISRATYEAEELGVDPNTAWEKVAGWMYDGFLASARDEIATALAEPGGQ